MYNAYVYRGGYAVVPSDVTELGPPMITGLYVGSAGSLVLVTEDGPTLTYPVVQAGTFITMRVRKVMATGTSASAINAHY